MEIDIPELIVSSDLLETIEGVLREVPGGISEYELIKKLTDRGYFSFLESSPWSTEDLFRGHFILFHLLYRLRKNLIIQEQGILEIHSLKIELLSYSSTDAGLDRHSKLSDYYLDINNLLETDSTDIYELLASFWNRFNRHENREQALTVLGLTDPVNDQEIKGSFRKLAHIHHPDRGGSTEEFQTLCSAVQMLLPPR